MLPLGACELLCSGLPRAQSFDDAMGLIERARSMMLGAGMLTVNGIASRQDETGEIHLKRIWTSEPDAYPVGGAKRKTPTRWTRQLLERCEVFVGEGDDALAEAFDDHRRIAALDMHSVVNVPIIRDGRCVATFNVLGRNTHWQRHEIGAIRVLALLAAPHLPTA